MKRLLHFVAGCAYAGLSLGVAMLGTGGGHGTSDYARIPIAPFSIPSDVFESGSVLPVLGIVFWGCMFVLCANARSALARTALAAGLLVHWLSAVALAFSAERQPDWPIILAPYLIGQLAFVMFASRALFRKGAS